MKQAATLFVIIAVVAGCVDPVAVTKLDQPEAEFGLTPRFGEHACSPTLANGEKIKIRYVEFVVPEVDTGSEKKVSIATWDDRGGFHVGYTNEVGEHCDPIQVTGTAPGDLKELVDKKAAELFRGSKEDCAGASGIYEKTSQLLEENYKEKVVAPLVGATLASLALACSGVEAPKPDDEDWVDEHLKEFIKLFNTTNARLFGEGYGLFISPRPTITTHKLEFNFGPRDLILFSREFVLEIVSKPGKPVYIAPSFYYSQCRPKGNKEEFRWGTHFQFSRITSDEDEDDPAGSVLFSTKPIDDTVLSGSTITAWNSPVTEPGTISACVEERSREITDCVGEGFADVVSAFFTPLYEQTKRAVGSDLNPLAKRELAEYVATFVSDNLHMFCPWTWTYPGDDAEDLDLFVTEKNIEAIVSKLTD